MEALFLRLINNAVAAGWLILAVMALRLIFRQAPRWVMCALWGLVALRLICPVTVHSRLSLVPDTAPVTAQAVDAIADMALPQRTETPMAEPAAAIHVSQAFPMDGEAPAVEAVTTPAPAPVKAGHSAAWYLSLVWLLGMAGILGYAAVSYLILWRRLSTAVRMKGNIWQSEAAPTPFIFGLIRPRIYLPFSIEPAATVYVLAHERTHIRRGDHIFKALGYVLLAVYWFDPFAWAAYLLLCRDIELACDEKVIKPMHAEGRKSYAAALLSCGIRRQAVLACPLTFAEVSVKERIRSVMAYKKPAFWLTVTAVVLCLAVSACVMTTRPEPEAEADISPAFTPAMEGPTAVTPKPAAPASDQAVSAPAPTATPIPTGWVVEDGKRYYYRDGEKQTGWVEVSGLHYYLDADGAMQTGWVEDGEKWYYTGSDGAMLIGWVEDGGKRYYLDDRGVMQTGSTKVNGKYYHFNTSGVMQTGWVDADGTRYIMGEDGAAETGFLKDHGVLFYLNEDGSINEGWKKIDGDWYYFRSLEGEVPEIDAYGGSAVAANGIEYIGKEYLFDFNGRMITNNWFGDALGESSYGADKYCLSDGSCAQDGWLTIGDNRYHFTNNPARTNIGWFEEGGYTYYLDPNNKGAMVTGECEIEGVIYTFDSEGHLMTMSASVTGATPN